MHFKTHKLAEAGMSLCLITATAFHGPSVHAEELPGASSAEGVSLNLTSSGSDIPVDEAHFPDKSFRDWIISHVGNHDAVLTSDEIAETTHIELDFNGSVSSLKGIEYFKELTFLDCSANNLSSLDVRSNTKLEVLYCGLNHLLSLDLTGLQLTDFYGIPQNVNIPYQISDGGYFADIKASDPELDLSKFSLEDIYSDESYDSASGLFRLKYLRERDQGSTVEYRYQIDSEHYLTCNLGLGSRYSSVVSMLRLYNPNTGEHFYTGSSRESDNLISYGWILEGFGWRAPADSGQPVYRLCNPNTGDHHYTMSSEEKDNLTAAGWTYEGVCWNSADDSQAPLYRLYNPNAGGIGSHFYTMSEEEKENLVRVGWNYEGIAWYGLK